MLKRHGFWLVLAIVFLSLTALIHASSLFLQPTPQNETERYVAYPSIPKQVAVNP
jgi:hypothetical protein